MVTRVESDSTYVDLPHSSSADRARERYQTLMNHLLPQAFSNSQHLNPIPVRGRVTPPPRPAPPPRPPQPLRPQAPLTRPHPHSNPHPPQDAYARARELTKSHLPPKKSSIRVIQNPRQPEPTPPPKTPADPPKANPPPANIPPDPPQPKKDLAASPQTLSSLPCVEPDKPPLTDAAEPEKQPMITFELPGIKLARGCIGGINGIGTDLTAAKSQADYLKQLVGNYHIEWVHNRTQSIPLDIVETIILTFIGISTPAEQLQAQWKSFHEKHKNDPEAKYLQFCHSQGALHVKNALLSAPQEIRDRVIVVAIAPATVVPQSLCFKSYNYTSKRDPIPYGQTAALLALQGPSSMILKSLFEVARELIVLDPHPEASLVDHSFKSPTFKDKIEKHIQEYIQQAASSTIA